MIRQPIVTVMGHVDHGKTTLLDFIRSSRLAEKEAGRITQHVGATEVPLQKIKDICGKLMDSFGIGLEIPGLLFIDTPGHAAFSNLRRRGGSVADIAVLVVDINQGLQPQTIEALEILRHHKTPFIVAANKVDVLTGWKSQDTTCFSESKAAQRQDTQAFLETKLYELVGKLSEHGINSNIYCDVNDFTKEVLVVPVSAKTGEGISELLMFLAGLSQKFMQEKLEAHETDAGEGTILEVKEEKGLGKTIDVILYNGKIERGDTIVFGAMSGCGTAKVKALLKPKPLEEIRDSKEKFLNMQSVHAASGVKIAAPGLEEAVAGAPVYVADSENLKETMKKVEAEVGEVRVDNQSIGPILKADTLGSLEAIAVLFKDIGLSLRRADIGRVTKKEVFEAETIMESDRYKGIIFAFNVPVDDSVIKEAEARGVKLFKEDVVYNLVESYEVWLKEEKAKEREEQLSKLTLPGKIKLIPGTVFRASKPAIVGVEVLAGRIKPNYFLAKPDGKMVGKIKLIQKGKKQLMKRVSALRLLSVLTV